MRSRSDAKHPAREKERHPASSAAPFSQRWLYDFYYAFEDQLLSGQKSILNAVLEGMHSEDASIQTSSASKKQKTAAVKIIQSVLSRNRRALARNTEKTEPG
tara:strand:- start:1621 stop:1926 length:306 start_codon:yes stop_codon:yes gene_type:complete